MPALLSPSVAIVVAALVAAPFAGGLLAGIDRKLSARMQHRQGPPVLQPFYDVLKLFGKKRKGENPTMRLFVALYLACVIVSLAAFLLGASLLLVVFLTALAALFFVLAGYSSRSPYADIGAMREIVQVAAYEPMLLMMCAGVYIVTGTFSAAEIPYLGSGLPLVCYLPLIFVGLVFVLTVKFRKSPFDISMSHHAHQEIVGGIKTEMGGSTLAFVEIAHWFETVLFLGWVAMFFIGDGVAFAAVAVAAALVVYFLETLIDNNFARVKYQKMLSVCWWSSLVLGAINLCVLPFMMLAW